MAIPTSSYRTGVGMVLVHPHTGQVLAGLRTNLSGVWQFPQGGVDPGEPVESAMWRELEEEFGLSRTNNRLHLIHALPHLLRYDYPHERSGFRGQEHTWFVLSFEGGPDDLRLDTHPPIEFETAKWMDWDELMPVVTPCKLEVYKILRAHVEGLRADPSLLRH